MVRAASSSEPVPVKQVRIETMPNQLDTRLIQTRVRRDGRFFVLIGTVGGDPIGPGRSRCWVGLLMRCGLRQPTAILCQLSTLTLWDMSPTDEESGFQPLTSTT